MNILSIMSNASKGLSAAGSFASEGALTFGVPIMAFDAAGAERGELVPSLASSGTGLLAAMVIAPPIGAVLALIPGVGAGIALGIVSGAIAGELADLVANRVRKDVRTLTQLDQTVRRLRMGGDYKDTQLAQRQRMLAVQEMNGTMINSRRYLGQEALLFNR